MSITCQAGEAPATPRSSEPHGSAAPTGQSPPLGVALSRRNLLALTAVVGSAAALPIGLRWAPPVSQVPLRASTFLPLVGRSFTFDLPDRAVGLLLTAVDGLGPAAVAEHAFTLRFVGPVAAAPGGQIGTLRGPGVSTALLVVPNGLPSGDRQDWSGTVNGGSHG